MNLTSVALVLCTAAVVAPASPANSIASTQRAPLAVVKWLPHERVEYRQAMRVAFLEACFQLCPAGDKTCIERCALRPLAEIASQSGDEEELRACNAIGGAWVAHIPACAEALARLLVVTSALEKPDTELGRECRQEPPDGLAQLKLMLEAATEVGRFCSPEGLCQVPPDAAAILLAAEPGEED